MASSAAYAYGEADDMAPSPPSQGPSGGASGNTLTAGAGSTGIKVTHISGGGSGDSGQTFAPVDPNWRPPACWYEPVATPEQLKDAVERLKKGGDLVPVTPTLSWGEELMVDHYEKGEAQRDGAGYKNFNLGEDGYFWRGVINESRENDIDSFDCERNLFWQKARTLPDEHAPTPDVLAAYAYDKIKVPDTEVELKPATKSTVNLPTWVWLDKGTFTEVKVRAELQSAGVWAETTAKPVALHLDPGTEDAETYPASGDCEIDADGSIGTPYSKGDADRTPPCGIRYLRASNDSPYRLKASITWEISWEGSGGAQGDLPDGTFETTQDMAVQEIQSINR
ncbi:hypothetical protein [Streptomyces pactum]|uniref:Secreted protein n=1 Tax=Streptomyces pactum TaxID=68249 RepID=A0A1S6JK57_9ACTN|nr:hypothetical protein [Streptomyces pactum]AQS72143.1 hypothetical protein B1H29_21785 [Streptomyces pactum]